MKLNLLLNNRPRKICILGNVAAGKTFLARQLSVKLNIPVTSVDAIQFDADLNINNLDQTRKKLRLIEEQEAWIIDGHGPLDMLENRFRSADQIILIDRPVWLNYILLTLRQLKNIFRPRIEFEGKKSELNWKHTKKVYRTVWSIHSKMRPELIRMIMRNEFKHKAFILGVNRVEKA